MEAAGGETSTRPPKRKAWWGENGTWGMRPR